MIDPMEKETIYGYDQLGNQVLVVYPDPDGDGLQDAPLTYREYDDAGQLVSESQGLARNEIQRLYFGSKASPVSIISDSSNYFSLTFDGYNTSGTIYDASSAQLYLESLANIGYGNILVTEAPGSMVFLFRGALADQNLSQINTSNYVRTADGVGISLTNIQSASSGTNETQLLSLGGATTGTFEIAGNSSYVQVNSLDTFGIQAALDSLFGSGNTSVYLDTSYEIIFQGAFAGENVPELLIYSNSTDGSPVFSTETQGVPGPNQIDQFSLTGSPDTGNWLPLLNSSGTGTPLTHDTSASSLESALNSMFYPQTFSVSSSSSGVWNVETTSGSSPGTWSFQTSGFMSGYALARTVAIETEELQPGGIDWWNTTTYEYDALGRMVQVTTPDPDGVGGVAASVTHYSYDLNGNQVKVRDPLQLETTYEYDFLNRRTVSIDALGGETTFVYDSNGNLRFLTDPVGNETEWIYDALNRIIDEENHLNDSRLFTYDAAGNLIQKQDRLGRVTIYEYDNLNRQTAEQWWSGTRPSVSLGTNADGSRSNEVQEVGFTDYSAPFTSGTFTLTVDGQTTSGIAWNANAATMTAALEALSNVGVGDVTVYKIYDYNFWQQWRLTFVGGLAGVNLPQVTIDPGLVDNGIAPPASETETTIANGVTVNEEQVVTLNSTTGGTFQLSFGGSRREI